MVESEIQLWLKKARQAGLSDMQIKTQLKQTGWSEQQIDQIFKGQAPFVSPKVEQIAYETTKVKGENTFIIIVIIVILIAIIASLLYFFVIKKEEKVSENNKNAVNNINITNVFVADINKNNNTNETVKNEGKIIPSEDQSKVDDLVMMMQNLDRTQLVKKYTLEAYNMVEKFSDLQMAYIETLDNIKQYDRTKFTGDTWLVQAKDKLNAAVVVLEEVTKFDNNQYHYKDVREFGVSLSKFSEGLSKLYLGLSDVVMTVGDIPATSTYMDKTLEVVGYMNTNQPDTGLEKVVQTSELKDLLNDKGFLKDHLFGIEIVKNRANIHCPELKSGETSIFCPEGKDTKF